MISKETVDKRERERERVRLWGWEKRGMESMEGFVGGNGN